MEFSFLDSFSSVKKLQLLYKIQIIHSASSMAQFTSQHCANVNLVFAELLPQILENLATSDLVGLRLVSRQWKEVATKILWTRGSLYLQFDLMEREFSQEGFTSLPLKQGWSSCPLCKSHRELESKLMRLHLDRKLSQFIQLLTSPSGRHRQGQLYTSSASSWSLTPSSSLPINHFGFKINSRSLKHSSRSHHQLVSFVQNFGHKLRALTLDGYCHYFEGQPGMPNFLLQYTPNLESLFIEDKDYDGTRILDLEWESIHNINKTDAPFTLPRLKLVEIRQIVEGKSLSWSTFEILPLLLKIAPQLERVSFQFLRELDILKVFPPSKINLIGVETLQLSGWELFFGGLEKLEHLVKIMMEIHRAHYNSKGVNLKCLIIDVGAWPPTREEWNWGTNDLRQILQLNQNSIEEIELQSGASVVLHKIPGLPALPKVTKLTVDVSSNLSYPRGTLDLKNHGDGDRGNSLCDLCPTVENIELSLPWNMSLNEFRRRFPFSHQELKLRQVKALKVNHVGSEELFVKILDLCPEMVTFSTTISESGQLLMARMQSLWSFGARTLTSLHLDFERMDPNRDLFVELDAALTGLSVETVLGIYNNWEQTGQWQEPKGQLRRVNSSLLDLTNLKKLKLNFDISYGEKPRLMVSRVSSKFGFDLMQNLEVLILFKLKSCPACIRKYTGEIEKWLDKHKAVSLSPNVKVVIDHQ